jgi:hypothetical protein
LESANHGRPNPNLNEDRKLNPKSDHVQGVTESAGTSSKEARVSTGVEGDPITNVDVEGNPNTGGTKPTGNATAGTK